MLNPTLYEALAERFGEVLVINEDTPGNFRNTRAYKEKLTVSNKVKQKNYADVLRPWGECYRVDCPACGDKKKRLYINYLAGAKLKIGSRWVFFSSRLFYCHNERCNVHNLLREEVKVNWGELAPDAAPVKQSLRDKQIIEVKFPSPIYPLISEEVPDEVYSYLKSRDFEPELLWQKYQVYYAPPGAVWDHRKKDGEEYDLTFRYPRIVIPIFKGYRMVSWQARVAMDKLPAGTPKYINAPDGVPKSELLYNMDEAKWHTKVGIVEGITDVWRGGTPFVATLGKDLHEPQQRIMKDLWGHFGWGVIFYDGDDPSALQKAKRNLGIMEVKKLFGSGCTRVAPIKGTDPANMSSKYLNDMLGEAVAYIKKKDKS